jgi:hypothetical protein
MSSARPIALGLTSSGITLADPNDRRRIDVVGFDTSMPDVIASFVRSQTARSARSRGNEVISHSVEIS